VTPVGRGGNQGKDLNEQDADLTYLSLEKNEWALRSLRLDDWGAIATREATPPPPQGIEKTIHHWWRSSWDTIWDEYQSGLGARDRPPAQLGGLWTGRRTLHEGL